MAGIKLHYQAAFPDPEINWTKRDVQLTDSHGKIIFRMQDVEAPDTWDDMAVNVVASKYMYPGTEKTPGETSVKEVIYRITRTISRWGYEDAYFEDKASCEAFRHDLEYLLTHQHGAFNSPVWFNVGLADKYPEIVSDSAPCYHADSKGTIIQSKKSYLRPQVSACFIQAVDDDIESIFDLAKSEALIFKYGGGTGTDLSTLRSTYESVSGGGTASGPLSFLRVYDSIAGVIRSGGRIRRAAKLNILDAGHPDIKDWIFAKAREEKKAQALIKQGYSGAFNGEAYTSVAYQNENLSVGIPDVFMTAVEQDLDWRTFSVTGSAQGPTYRARDVFNWIAECAHACGDPGLQFSGTINHWNTVFSAGSINSSNPCGEFMFLDNSACNLASLNLVKFKSSDNPKAYMGFDFHKFRAAVRTFIIAQDILVSRGAYPTRAIAQNSEDFRPLGLGFANFGAYVMSCGLGYDSDTARLYAKIFAAEMTVAAYSASVELAKCKGAYNRYSETAADMGRVLRQHTAEIEQLGDAAPDGLLYSWCNMLDAVPKHGLRNAQVTLLAPTGTIGFVMGCDTTGIEPAFSLVSYKSLVGGGVVCKTLNVINTALMSLGYDQASRAELLKYLAEHGTFEGAPILSQADLAVFDCAVPSGNGTRCLSWQSHLEMVAAVQPFLSGAVSKTINLPSDVTVETIKEVYMAAWKAGLKGVTVYRDGCKASQPLTTSDPDKVDKPAANTTLVVSNGTPPVTNIKRHVLPVTRNAVIHKFNVGGHEGYFAVGLYKDGKPGELFINMSKEGSTIGGLMDAFGTAISMCLQHGVSLSVLVNKFSLSRFEPSGITGNKDIPFATSLVDYIFKWLSNRFIDTDAPVVPSQAAVVTPSPVVGMLDNPLCDTCGSMTIRNGRCFKCTNCGTSLGCS